VSGASVATRLLPGFELSRRWRVALGAGSIAGIGALSLAVCLMAAAGVSFVVPATRRSFTTWLAGPLHGIVSRTLTADQTIIVLVLLCVCYAGALLWARSVPVRWVIAAIVLLHVLYAIAPPLLSKDIFSYIGYARLGASHHVDPYTHGVFLFPHDPVFVYAGWTHVASAYGPLFTVATYPLAFVSVAAAVWTIKIVTAIASLALVWLVWFCAKRIGRDPLQAVIWVGLNPILLLYGVGGAHNDLIRLTFMVAAAALVLAGREGSAASSIVVAAAVKASGAVMLPFLFLRSREKRRVAIGTLAAFVPLVIMSYVAFGSGATGQFKVLKRQQLLVSGDSIPAQLGKFLGLGGVTSDVRLVARLVGFATLAYLCWRVWKGTMDWLVATGWAMLVAVVTSSWLLGWYALWPLPFAALAKDRRLQGATLCLMAYFVAMRWTVFI
jgi:hypothetical protein